MGLSKQTETGATMGVVHNINWSYQNSSFLVWPSAYTTNIQLTLTQPLLGSAPLPGQAAGRPVGLEANRAPIVIARLNADAAVWRFKAEIMAHCPFGRAAILEPGSGSRAALGLGSGRHSRPGDPQS